MSSDPLGNEMIFYGRNSDKAVVGAPAERSGNRTDEVLSLLCIRPRESVKKTKDRASWAALLQAESALSFLPLVFPSIIN